MEEHMQRKLLGVCYWTSVVLGTKPTSFSLQFSQRKIFICSATYWQRAGLYHTLMYRPHCYTVQSVSASYLRQASFPEEPLLKPQGAVLKVHFQDICTYLPVIAKLIGQFTLLLQTGLTPAAVRLKYRRDFIHFDCYQQCHSSDRAHLTSI